MRRHIRNILKISALALVLVGLLMNGFFSPFNYVKAKHDIRLRQFNKICINKHPARFIVEKEVASKYGITVKNISNEYNLKPINYFGIKTYNRLMKKAFIKYKGESLYKKYVNELDSLQLQFITL